MAENFEAIIGANIRDFQQAMRAVDRQIRETAMGAEADIGADISEFMSEMGAVESILTDLAREHDISIDAEVADAVADVVALDAAVSALPNNVDIDISTDISDVVADVAVVRASLWQLIRDRIFIPIETRVNNFQQTIARIATFTRSFQELQQTTSRGIMISLSPALVPLIATLGGLIGDLGPMIGVLASSTFALGSAFLTAGIGAVAFGALAVTNLKGVFEESKSAATALDLLKDTWSGIAKETKAGTVEAFVKSMNVLSFILNAVQPMFVSVTAAANRLMASLATSVNSESMRAFFDYLNKSAGPMMETVFKSIGNLLKGFFSMMVAFGPLAESTAQGFLKMSEGFATWAAGLGKSDKFQSFVNYVNENMPKIRAIFRDAFAGITYLFAAFGPSSSDMMTSLQDMMARFKEWAKTLGQNQQFQAFIDYIKTNGPKVAELIGNITTFLVNLGIALAPMGSSILDIVNSFLVWSSAMLENHPWIGKILAAVIVLMGALIAIAPNVIALATLFSGVSSVIPIVSAALLALRVRLVTGVAMMLTSLGQLVVRAATAAASMVVSFARMAASAAITAAQFVARIAVMVAQWVLLGAQALIHAARVAAAWALSTGAAMARSIASMIASSAVFVAKWALMGVQALLHAAKMAAAWFIALGPVGWVIAAVVGLAILIIANWDKIKTATVKIWKSVSDAVKTAWEEVKSYASKMVSAGADLIQGLIDGAVGMASDAIGAIKRIAGDMVDAALSFFKIKSPSRVFKGIGQYVSEGLGIGVDDKAKLAIQAVTGMASAMTNAFTPQLAMPVIDLGISRLDATSEMDDLKRQIKQELSVDMSVNHKGSRKTGGYSEERQPLIIQIVSPDERVMAEWLVDDITQLQEFKQERINIFKGG